jgi:outer membrane protein assembly factor BamB
MFVRFDRAPLANFARRHHLSDPFTPPAFCRLECLQVIVASEKAVHCFDYGQFRERRFLVRVAEGERISALTTAPTMEGDKIVFGTRSGRVYVLNDDGFLESERAIAAQAVLRLSGHCFEGAPTIFACCADRRLRLLDTQGQVQATLAMPGNLLSAQVSDVSGRPLMLAGAQGWNEVFLWDLLEVLATEDAAPQTVLKGGSKPAFAARFITADDETLLAHSSWDRNVYLYRLTARRNGDVLRPFKALYAGSSLYPLQQGNFNGQPFLFAGAEDGNVYSWRLGMDADPLRPASVIPTGKAGIKVLRAAAVGPARELVLFTGNRGGQLYLLQRRETGAYSSQVIFTLPKDEGEVRGVDLIYPQ